MNTSLLKVFSITSDYTQAVSEFLNLAFQEGITPIKKLNGYRQEVKKKHRLSGYASILAIKYALAIHKA